MKKYSQAIAVLLLVIFTSGLAIAALTFGPPKTPSASGSGSSYEFKYWNPGAKSLNELTTFVENAVKEGTSTFIPAEDRIAVFDFDGTLYGELAPVYVEYMLLHYRITEDPDYKEKATEEQKAVAKDIEAFIREGKEKDDLSLRHAKAAAEAYAGMTIREFHDFVLNYAKNTKAQGFDGLTYYELFYMPMIEVVEYLQANDFTVYICSGSDRFICRAITDGVLNIKDNNVIGMDVTLVSNGQGDTDGLEYVYKFEDDVVRGDKLVIKNLKMNKVYQIVQEIGKQPVLSFGNSSGDTSMATYVTDSNKYPSKAFMLVADDSERDYGDPGKAAELDAKWKSLGFVSISMKNDFKTIYKPGAVKTQK